MSPAQMGASGEFGTLSPSSRTEDTAWSGVPAHRPHRHPGAFIGRSVLVTPGRFVLGCLLLLASIACGGMSDSGGPTRAEMEQPPYAAGVTIGETYSYEMYTHCGIHWTRIDGTWWETSPIGVNEAEPPSGWGNPYDAGRMTIVDHRTAVYDGPDGDVQFSRTSKTEPPFVCM